MQSAIDQIRHRKKRAFLVAFCETGQINLSAKAAGCNRTVHYQWLHEDAAYRAAFEEATKVATGTLEDSAFRRARDGIRRPVLYKGQQVTIKGEPLWEHEYSDTMAIFLLKGLDPEKYRERWSGELTGKDGKPLLDLASVRAFMREDDKPDE